MTVIDDVAARREYRKVRVLTLKAVSWGCLVVLATLGSLMYVIVRSWDRDISDSERLACAAKYSDATTVAQAQVQTAIGDLVVAISTIPPGPARTAAIASIVGDGTNKGRLAVATDASTVALVARIAYTNAGRPLPCPFPNAP